MHSFTTHDVPVNSELSRRFVTLPGSDMWAERFTDRQWTNGKEIKTQKQRIWNCSDSKFLMNANGNAVMTAVGLAYNQHLPLSLSPDAIWSVVAHGFSIWINENAEKVRTKFVSHAGKVKLVVGIPAFEAHDPNWNRIMKEFSDKLSDHIGKKRDLFVNDFSTTTVDDRIGSEALLMYGMSKYFDYGMKTLCGFPKITIEGNPEDWEKIVDRVRTMGEYSLGNEDQLKIWVDNLLPTLEEFVTASKGNPNIDFWRSFYKEGGGSGGPYIGGHVVKLFPYLKTYKNVIRVNNFNTQGKTFEGPTTGDFLQCYSPVDVEWEDTSTVRDMKFYGGVIGVSFKENILRPEVGWCISEEIK